MRKYGLKKIVWMLGILCFLVVSLNTSIFAADGKNVVLGDVNEKYILKVINDLPSDGVKAADVNADGQIKKYMLKAVEKFPGEASNNPDAVIQFESGFAHSVLLKKDGTVWVLGNNGKGQLGLPEVSAVNEPVMINGLSGIKSVAAGREHTLALQEDGTLWGETITAFNS